MKIDSSYLSFGCFQHIDILVNIVHHSLQHVKSLPLRGAWLIVNTLGNTIPNDEVDDLLADFFKRARGSFVVLQDRQIQCIIDSVDILHAANQFNRRCTVWVITRKLKFKLIIVLFFTWNCTDF